MVLNKTSIQFWRDIAMTKTDCFTLHIQLKNQAAQKALKQRTKEKENLSKNQDSRKKLTVRKVWRGTIGRASKENLRKAFLTIESCTETTTRRRYSLLNPNNLCKKLNFGQEKFRRWTNTSKTLYQTDSFTPEATLLSKTVNPSLINNPTKRVITSTFIAECILRVFVELKRKSASSKRKILQRQVSLWRSKKQSLSHLSRRNQVRR